jgi:GNAT superfamily N-acetyltransferase
LSDDGLRDLPVPPARILAVEVRAAAIGDADRIAALNAAGWRAGFRGLISDAYLTAYDGLPRLRHETLAEPGDDDIQLVAVDGEEMIGWVAGGPAQEDDLGPGAYEVRACYVDPARWRTGVGRWLMAALIDRLDPGRWTHLVLWTVRDADPTNAFYVSLGMVRDGREALLDRGGPVPLVRFSVLLKRMRTNAPTTTVPRRTDG